MSSLPCKNGRSVPLFEGCRCESRHNLNINMYKSNPSFPLSKYGNSTAFCSFSLKKDMVYRSLLRDTIASPNTVMCFLHPFKKRQTDLLHRGWVDLPVYSFVLGSCWKTRNDGKSRKPAQGEEKSMYVVMTAGFGGCTGEMISISLPHMWIS